MILDISSGRLGWAGFIFGALVFNLYNWSQWEKTEALRRNLNAQAINMIQEVQKEIQNKRIGELYGKQPNSSQSTQDDSEESK